MRITDDVYRVDGVSGANAYVVDLGDHLLLVDTGLGGNAERIAQFARGVGGGGREIGTIVITHADPDHTGSLVRLKELTGAQVAVHAKEAPVLSGEAAGKQVGGFLGAVFSVMRGFVRMSPVSADRLLLEGDDVDGFEVLEVPGHTAGSIALWRERDGVLITGDALLTDRDGAIRGPMSALSEDMEAGRASADRLRALDARWVLPGHGKPLQVSPRERNA